jgi:hypothetical protein
VTTVGSALIPLVNAQQQRALAFPREIEKLRDEGVAERSSSSPSLNDEQRDQLNSRVAATLTHDDDLYGLTTRAKQAVQAYQSQAVDAEREQISHMLGVDMFA